MQKELLTYGKLSTLLFLSMWLHWSAFAQYSFDIPQRATDRILSYNAIQVEVSGKLALCSHTERGHINLQVSGGTAPYTFLWNTNETSQNRSNLLSGTYTVEITDAQGAKHTEHIIIQPPFPLLLNPIETQDASCGSGRDGYAKVSVKIGRNDYEPNSPPYKIKWSNGLENVWESDQLEPGTYTVTVTDKYACDVSVSFEIKAAAEGIQVQETIDQPSCESSSAGRIALAVTGGVAPYTFLWENGATTQTVENLAPGNYAVTVKDSKGCSFQATYEISAPQQISIQEQITQPSCEGSANGQIQLTVQGGLAPYTYSWNNGSSTKNLEELSAGTYTATVTDASGCSVEKSFVLQNDAPLEINLIQAKDVSCSGDNDGEIEINVSGAKGQWKILWSDGVEGLTHRTNLKAGTYQVQVSDASGCQVSQEILLNQSAGIQARIESMLDVNCESGMVLGNAWVSIQGGIEPYQITWNNGQENQHEITFSKTETLKVTVKDAVGCVVETETKVDFPQSANRNGRLEFNYRKLVINSEPKVLTDEEILFESEIDPEFIAWQWEFGDGSTSVDKDPIHVFTSPGTYEVRLTGFDSFGCSSFEINTVEVSSITPQVTIPNAFTPNGDGLNDLFIPKMKGVYSFQMEIFDTWGERLFTTHGLESKGWDGTYRGQLLPPGNYLYKITYADRNGTQSSRSGGITLIR